MRSAARSTPRRKLWLSYFYLLLIEGDFGSFLTRAFVFDVLGCFDASTILTLGAIKLIFVGLVVGLGSMAVVVDFDVVSGVSTVDFDVDVGLVIGRCTVPVVEHVSV